VAGVDLKITPTRANSFCATAAPCGGTGGLGRGAAWRIQSPGHLISDAEVSAAPSLCVCDCLVCKRPLSGSKSGSSIHCLCLSSPCCSRAPLSRHPHMRSLFWATTLEVCARVPRIPMAWVTLLVAHMHLLTRASAGADTCAMFMCSSCRVHLPSPPLHPPDAVSD
jgi:hypothetical protein